MRPRSWSFPLLAVLLSTALALPLLELVLRLEYMTRQWYKPSLAYLSDDLGWLPTPNLSTRYTKKGYEGEISYSTDGRGFRRFGDPQSGKRKVWAIGDSTTQAYQVSDGQAYYDVLAERAPEFELFAYGVGGYGTVQQAMALERYWDEIRPDVVLWQMCDNDLINNDWQLESLSTDHNNHMARPYLEADGSIVLRHPDRRLGWLARRSLLVRRLAVLRSSLRSRLHPSIESELDLGNAAMRRSIATTRRALAGRIAAAPEVTFLAFFVRSPNPHGWEEPAWREICTLPGLECLPEVGEAIEEARRAGIRVDGGRDPHWNATGHTIAARVISERLRRDRAR